MKIQDIINETTTSGSVASVSVPMTTVKRGGNLLTGKKTNKKYGNSVVSEWNNLGFNVKPNILYPSVLFESEHNDISSKFKEYIASKQHTNSNLEKGQPIILAMVLRTGDEINVFYGNAAYVDEDSDTYKLQIDSGTNLYSKKNQIVFGDENKFKKFIVDLKFKFEKDDIRVNIEKMPITESLKLNVNEEDLIVIPGMKSKRKNGFIPREQDRTDHEVEMARSDLIALMKNTKTVFQCIKDIPEEKGIEGWVQEKIIKSSDYMNTLAEYLEGKQYSDSHDKCDDGCNCDDTLNEDTMPIQNAVDSANNIVKQFRNADMHLDIIRQITELAKRVGLDESNMRTLEYSIDNVLEKQRELESSIYGLVDVFKDELYSRNRSNDLDESKSKDNKYAIGMWAAKKKAGYGEKPAHDLPKSVIKKAHSIAKKI